MTPEQIEKLEVVRRFMAELGDAVYQTRVARKMSLRQLAREVGIDHVQLSRVEHGVWVLTPEETERVAAWMREET